MNSSRLIDRKSQPLPQGTPPLSAQESDELMRQLKDWKRQGEQLVKTCSFKNYYETMAFVNAVAWIANTQDHHPDLEVGYNKCRVHYSTHAVKGLSQNDFICAAKTEQLFA